MGKEGKRDDVDQLFVLVDRKRQKTARAERGGRLRSRQTADATNARHLIVEAATSP